MQQLRLCGLAALVVLSFAADRATAEVPDARQIMERTFDAARVSFRGKMRLVSPGGLERLIDVQHRQDGRASRTYMEITAPFNLRDTRFLSFEHVGRENEHFTYVPMVKRSMQVPKWTLEQPFLGSDFYMIDIAIPDMDDFRYRFEESREIGGTERRCVASEPKRPAGEPYSKVVYCVDEAKWLSIHTEYFDDQGALLKVWSPTRVEEVQGVWTPRDQTMRNIQGRTESRLEILEIEYHVDIPEEIFSKAHLDR